MLHLYVKVDCVRDADPLRLINFLLFGIPELFGVQGVPMLFILTENGLISWQARFAACRQEDLDLFLKEAIQELDRNEASLQLGKVGQGGNSTNSNNQNTINQSNILPYGANRGKLQNNEHNCCPSCAIVRFIPILNFVKTIPSFHL